jgi:hypothetical protein
VDQLEERLGRKKHRIWNASGYRGTAVQRNSLIYLPTLNHACRTAVMVVPGIVCGMLVSLVLGNHKAAAQTTQTVTVSSNVPQVLSLSVDTNSVSIPFLTSDYNSVTGAATKTATAANTVSVVSNKSWTVSVKANTAAFSFTPSLGDADPSKPAGNLSYKLSSGGSYTVLTTSNAAVKTGSKGGSATSGNSFSVDYQLTSNLSQDPPGTYSLAVVYTLTAP